MSDQVVEPLFLMHIFGNNYEKETQMQTAVYARKSFNVEAVQVTQENIEEVANWCGGQIKENRDGAPYIKIDVKRALNERQRRAYLGDWVLLRQDGDTFKVYDDKAFGKCFDAVNEAPDAPYMVG